MLFERRPVAQTEATILAHSIRLAQGTLKKGHVLTAADIKTLTASGYESIVVASLEDGDLGEDTAAGMVAQALSGNHLVPDKPFTGRCNLKSGIHGLAIIDNEAVNQINFLDESITIATLLPYAVVQPKQLVATVKIIPFAVPAQSLKECVQIAHQHAPLIRLAPFQAKSVGFIQSRLPGTRESILDKTSKVLAGRLDALHSRIVDEIRCRHKEKEITAAITRHLQSGADIIIVTGASAITDRKDTVPCAIEHAGGHIIHFGMPVDPGNLLLLAAHGDYPVLGMPGCARSPELNGFDWILERLIADVPVTAEDIMRMGTGGLLKEITTRPQPRLARSATE